jgi:hypothetical protein
LKSQSSIEKKDVEPIANDNIEIKEEVEEEEEDPLDNCQLGDMFWVRVVGNPWWPALIYGNE